MDTPVEVDTPDMSDPVSTSSSPASSTVEEATAEADNTDMPDTPVTSDLPPTPTEEEQYHIPEAQTTEAAADGSSSLAKPKLQQSIPKKRRTRELNKEQRYAIQVIRNAGMSYEAIWKLVRVSFDCTMRQIQLACTSPATPKKRPGRRGNPAKQPIQPTISEVTTQEKPLEPPTPEARPQET